jgi:hypothetical protein
VCVLIWVPESDSEIKRLCFAYQACTGAFQF